MNYDERLKRRTIVENWLKKTFPTMAHEVASADDFFTGRFLFKIHWDQLEGQQAGFYLEVNPQTIDHIATALTVKE